MTKKFCWFLALLWIILFIVYLEEGWTVREYLINGIFLTSLPIIGFIFGWYHGGGNIK